MRTCRLACATGFSRLRGERDQARRKEMAEQFSSAPQRRRGSGVTIAVIIALTIITLACIGSSTYLTYIFLQNPPW
jgi:hypothetical protein